MSLLPIPNLSRFVNEAASIISLSLGCLLLTSCESAQPTKSMELKLSPNNDIARSAAKEIVKKSPSSLAIELSFTGQVEDAQKMFDEIQRNRFTKSANNLPCALTELNAVNALDAIEQQAQGKRIVFLNEAHHVPLNRAFAGLVAGRLRKIGFSYLAVEALGDNIEQNIRGEVILESAGYYTREPYFASFLRSALTQKWKLVNYDVGGDQLSKSGIDRINEREEREAENIIQRILTKDPAAKIFVYAGYGHIDKTKNGKKSEVTMMAEHVRRLTNLPTLHIDQVTFYPHFDKSLESTSYANVIAYFAPNAPIVLRRKIDNSVVVSSDRASSVDMEVIFPMYSFRDANGRPEWISSLLNRVPVNLNPAVNGYPETVRAYLENDPPGAVPLDTIRVDSEKSTTRLLVPSNARLRIERSN